MCIRDSYDSAEYWFMRAVHRLPGRIYPYYLLANLYADPFFYRCDKLERMVQTLSLIHIYCLGYIWENKDVESFEENLNPSVVALEFNELFSKVR